MTRSARLASAARTIFSVKSGSRRSSLSTNWTYLPLATFMPSLRVMESPALGLSIRVMRGSLRRNCSQMARLPSVEPSFSTMTSISFQVCARTLSRHRATLFCTVIHRHDNADERIVHDKGSPIPSLFSIKIRSAVSESRGMRVLFINWKLLIIESSDLYYHTLFACKKQAK